MPASWEAVERFLCMYVLSSQVLPRVRSLLSPQDLVWDFQELYYKRWVLSCSVVSDFLQPHGLHYTRFLCPESLQARILEQVAISSSRGSSQHRDCTHASCVSVLAGRFFTTELPGKPLYEKQPEIKASLQNTEAHLWIISFSDCRSMIKDCQSLYLPAGWKFNFLWKKWISS